MAARTRTQTQPAVSPIRGWSPQRIESAKSSADAGYLALAADLVERMLGDDRAAGPLQALAGISGLEITFESEVEENPDDDDRVVALRRDWWHLFPEDTQGEVLRWAALLGVVVAQVQDWVKDESTGRVLPLIEPWHPRFLSYDSTSGKGWKLVTREHPAGIYVSDYPGEFMLFTPYGAQRPWTKAPWYGLGVLWLMAAYAKLGWGEYNDTTADPIREVYRETSGAGGMAVASVPSQANLDELQAKAESVVRGGAIVLPDGWRMRLLSALENGHKTFADLCDQVWPKAVAIALTGNNLTTQIEGGSFAAAQYAGSVALEHKRTYARCLETTLRGTRLRPSGVLVQWCEFNFGDSNAPWPHYKTDPPEDQQAIAAGAKAGADALSTLDAAGWELEDESDASRIVGYSVKRKLPKPVGRSGANQPPPPTKAAAVARRGEQLATTLDIVAASRSLAAEDDADDYDDELVASAVQAAREALSVDVEELVRIVNSVPDDGDPIEWRATMRRKVLERYANTSPEALVDIVQRTEILAGLNGRAAVIDSL